MKLHYFKILGLSLSFLGFVSQTALAQTPIFSEDFSGGAVPASWTNMDLSTNNTMWSWCGDPVGGVGAGCVGAWTTYNNQHDGVFSSTTAANGFLVFDSDGAGPIEHQATISTEALDFSAESEVFLKFESLIGIWELPTPGNALVRVSSDNVNWTDFDFINIRRGQDGNETEFTRWSLNPEVTVLDISSVAAGQSTVYIQWFWRGSYEYYWLLDDIEVYNEDVRDLFLEKYDLRVTSFFAGAPNAQTPIDQVTPFSFLADVYNPGYEAASNAVLKVEVLDDSNTAIFSEELPYGNLSPDSLAENQSFMNSFTTPNTIGDYVVRYTLSSDDTDLIPEDNVAEFPYAITDTVFAKENGITDGLEAPTPGATDGAPWSGVGQPRGWVLGNYYHIVDGTNKYPRSVSFGIENADIIANKVIIAFLWKWDDENSDGVAQEAERLTIATATYVVTGTETPGELITLALEGNQDPLSDDSGYIIAVSYTAEGGEEFSASFSVNNDFDYRARVFQDGEMMVDNPYYGPMTGFGNDAGSLDITAGGFWGDGYAPVVRLSVGASPISSNEDIFSTLEFSLTPNVSKDQINININLEDNTSGVVKIMNTKGSLIEVIDIQQLNGISIPVDVSDYAAGTYFLQLNTDNAASTRKFVVVK